MSRYAITGAHGFLGWHLRCRLLAEQPATETRVLGRGDLDDPGRLADVLNGCDAVFHLAGVNSHDATEAATNVDLAGQLATGLARLKKPPSVVYSNSAQAGTAAPYGRAKAAAAEVLARWASTGNATFVDVVLPNLFGEGGRPRYNSAVATFCEAIIDGRPVEVNPAGRVELLHAQDAASALLAAAGTNASGRKRVRGEVIAVPEIYDTLARLHEVYRSTQTVPSINSRLVLRLFNQLRVALFPAAYPVEVVGHADARGAFFEAVRGSGDGQTSFSTTVPAVTRGDHWHVDKIERFLVLRGKATIEVRRLFDDIVHTFEVVGDRPAFVDMPTLHAHSVSNTGQGELLTMFWANDHFDPSQPDTYPEPVRRPPAVAR